MERLVALLRCTSCRFAALYFIPFFGGLAGSGQGYAGWAVLGAVFWFAHCLGTEGLNRISDRTEDEINRPERTAMCREYGFPALRRVALGAWLVVGVLDCAVLTARPGLFLAALLLLAAISAIGYSYGPKLSRHRYVSLIILTFPFGGTFLIGWAIAHATVDLTALRDLLLHAGPVAVAGGLSIGALAGVKDLTDISGDRAVGYRAVWSSVVSEHTDRAAITLAVAPFAVIAGFIASGLLTIRFLALFCLLPLALLVARSAYGARSGPEIMATRELFYNYWILLESVAMILYAPQVATGLAILAAVSWWTLASRYLHWIRAVPTQWLAAIRSIAAR